MVYTFARFLICAHKCRTLYDFACSVLFCMCVYGYLISEISLESKHCHRMKTLFIMIHRRFCTNLSLLLPYTSNLFCLSQEDQFIGYKIVHYTVSDNDLDPNGPPFTFDIVSGNEGQEFRIEPTGILSTAGKFNKDIRDKYTLTVRVFDNGTPNLYSDVVTTIHIIEEGMNPPEVQNLDITISSYEDKFPGGVIGRVDASDKDLFDSLSYRVVSPNRHLFDVGIDDGRLIAYSGLDSGSYVVNVSVSDKKNTVYGTVRVEVLLISTSMLESSVTMQIQNLSPTQFLLDYQRNFQKAVKKALNVRANDVQIINIQPSGNLGGESRMKRSADQNDLDVLFVVQRSAGGAFFRRKKLERKLRQNLNDIESELGKRIVKVFGDVCPQVSCRDGQCIGVITFNKSLTTIKLEGKSFVTAKHSYSYKCLCTNGIEGKLCFQQVIQESYIFIKRWLR